MSHLPIIVALSFTGSNPEGPSASEAWFALEELERIVYAFSSLRDEDGAEDFDSGQSEPGSDVLGQFWTGGADGRATLGVGNQAETNAIQLSGPASSGAFWSLGDVDLAMNTPGPLAQAFTGGASRMAFVVRVLEPTRVDAFAQLQVLGSADSFAWARLRVGADGSGPFIFTHQTTDGEALLDAPLTLPVGQYTLEAGARAEVFDVFGDTTAGSGFVVSFTPTTSCNAADIAEPVGSIDINDVIAFLDAYADQRTDADLAWPPLAFSIDDVIEFLRIYSEGCP